MSYGVRDWIDHHVRTLHNLSGFILAAQPRSMPPDAPRARDALDDVARLLYMAHPDVRDRVRAIQRREGWTPWAQTIRCCPVCGATFATDPVRGAKRKHCSDRCYNRAYWHRRPDRQVNS